MCGIAGMVGLTAEEWVLEKMLKTMARRGPDGQGVYMDKNCTLLHTRLAIIDPEGGKQPMLLTWSGETYVISYNGELYNTEQLRQMLMQAGHCFTGYSDTEVVLHAYAQWGSGCLEKLNGIFAFAVWHCRAQELFVARDRMGVKPFFYMEHNGGFLFASEIKTILAFPSVRGELDAVGVGEILLLGPGRTPGSGVFHNIFELEPGCCGLYTCGRLHITRYWSLQDREHTDSFPETVSHVRELVLDAIRRQMVSDVPIGTFLSGGLDSSLISAVCAERLSGQLDTFSVDYENNDKYFRANKFQPESDNSYIRMMQEAISSQHHWTVLSADDLFSALEDATRARDLPGMADVDFSLMVFCADIRRDVKVALSGECADEIFGGYPWYRDPEVRAVEGFPWAQNTKQRASFLHRQYQEIIKPEEFVQERYWQTIANTDVLPGTNPQEKRMKEMVNLNYRWFMQTLLDRKDRMSMYQGLEVRVPFCDYRIAEYLYSVPWEYKDYAGKEKGLLRTAMEGILPERVLWRKKSPYPKTFDPRYMELVSNALMELLATPAAPIFQLVRRDALQNLLTAEYAWPWYGQLMKIPQTIAFMLQLNFWLREYSVCLI